MADSKRNKNRCSFCGRTEDEVGFLITGMNGYICDSCATQAYEITQEALSGAKRSGAATKLNLRELPKPLEIKEFLDNTSLDRMMQNASFPCRYTITINACCKKTAVMMWKLKSLISSW